MCVYRRSYPKWKVCTLCYTDISGLYGCTIFSPYYFINDKNFVRRNIEQKCVLILRVIFVWNISFSKKNWTTYDKKVHKSSCKIPLFFSWFKGTWTFLADFWKISNIKFNENPSMGAVLFHADRRTYRQTDMSKLVVAFRNFANTPKNNR